jgi:hypothetical protein
MLVLCLDPGQVKKPDKSFVYNSDAFASMKRLMSARSSETISPSFQSKHLYPFNLRSTASCSAYTTCG